MAFIIVYTFNRFYMSLFNFMLLKIIGIKRQNPQKFSRCGSISSNFFSEWVSEKVTVSDSVSASSGLSQACFLQRCLIWEEFIGVVRIPPNIVKILSSLATIWGMEPVYIHIIFPVWPIFSEYWYQKLLYITIWKQCCPYLRIL